jgi:hypothetical protein
MISMWEIIRRNEVRDGIRMINQGSVVIQLNNICHGEIKKCLDVGDKVGLNVKCGELRNWELYLEESCFGLCPTCNVSKKTQCFGNWVYFC